MPIRAITFDLDDTLWDVGDAIRIAERNAFAYLSEHCPNITKHQDIVSLRQLMLQLLEEEPELTHRISHLRKKTLARAVEQSGYSAEEADRHATAAFNIFLEGRHQVSLFQDVLPVLQALHQRYTIGALTNGNADINRLTIGPYFDFSFSAEQFRRSKPHPTLFRAALDFTGLTASECVHVGDHPEHDILGAQQAGFFSIWVNLKGDAWPGGTPASAEINNLSELPQAIKHIETLATL